MRAAAEKDINGKLSASIADSVRAREVASALVQKFDGDAAEKMAFIRDFSREKNTEGTLSTLETVTKNGLPAVVTERKRRGVPNVEDKNEAPEPESIYGFPVVTPRIGETVGNERNARETYVKAFQLNIKLVERYNREYNAGKWSTNRPLAGKSENAFSAASKALIAYKAEVALSVHNENLRELLTGDKETQARVALAGGASHSALNTLSTSHHDLVRRNVAINPSLPADAAFLLSKDDNIFVKRDLASNPNIPVTVQLVLAASKDDDTRRSLFNNKNVTAEAVAALDARDKKGGHAYGYSHSKEETYQSGYNQSGVPSLVRIVE
jgi:hypothetical protein